MKYNSLCLHRKCTKPKSSDTHIFASSQAWYIVYHFLDGTTIMSSDTPSQNTFVAKSSQPKKETIDFHGRAGRQLKRNTMMGGDVANATLSRIVQLNNFGVICFEAGDYKKSVILFRDALEWISSPVFCREMVAPT